MSEGTDLCEFLEWDTAFFGVRIGRVRGGDLTPERVGLIDEWSRQHQINCLYFLARSDDAATTRLAEDNGFRLLDVRVTLDRGLNGEPLPALNAGVAVRQAAAPDVSVLKRIARQAHRDTRFYYDPMFSREVCDRLYETWIEFSCNGYAQAVWVADLAGAVVGYVSCHTDAAARVGRIGLVGVSDEAQGRGAGQSLVCGALAWFQAQGMGQVTVATQGRNRAAQRLYQRCGFLSQKVELWYHKWFSTGHD